MSNDLISLSKRFISIRSESDNKEALVEIFDLALSQLKGYRIEHFQKDGTKSALIYATKRRPNRFKVILSGHLDVIPGKADQYAPRVKGNRLYGAGSMDMKANVACLLRVFKETAQKVSYPLALQLVTDEETGGFKGAKHQVEKGVKAEFVLAGEPTNFNVVNRAKGILWLRFSARGKTAHGAYPWKGDNAIWKMNSFLNKLQKKYPIPIDEKWATTINLSKVVTSNVALNKVPDDCMVDLDVRYIPKEADKVIRDIRKILSPGLKLEVLAREPAMFSSSSDQYVKSLRRSVRRVLGKNAPLRGANGSSDARHFNMAGSSCVEFGSVGGGIASDSEWVSIPSLEKYCDILKDFLLSIDQD